MMQVNEGFKEHSADNRHEDKMSQHLWNFRVLDHELCCEQGR
jgi:hypothetical protein